MLAGFAHVTAGISSYELRSGFAQEGVGGAEMTYLRLEGWCTDPFGKHDARWISVGTPTSLVRDSGNETYDDPPDEPPRRVPERIVTVRWAADSLRRADDAQREDFDGRHLVDAAFEAVAAAPGTS